MSYIQTSSCALPQRPNGDANSPSTISLKWASTIAEIRSNRDDHLRNHGFVLGQTGWRLAPAFDVNPNIDKAEHVLNIDDGDNRPSLATVLASAEFYGLTPARAQEVVDEVATAVDGWQDAARTAGMAGADIALTEGAFSAHSEHRRSRKTHLGC